MDATSPVLINKALDALSLRYEATAQNIANANSRTFEPMRVSFEENLKAAAARGNAAVRDMPVTMSRAEPSALGGEPRLDLELATASETAMRYTALLDMLGRELQIDRAAVGGGQ